MKLRYMTLFKVMYLSGFPRVMPRSSDSGTRPVAFCSTALIPMEIICYTTWT